MARLKLPFGLSFSRPVLPRPYLSLSRILMPGGFAFALGLKDFGPQEEAVARLASRTVDRPHSPASFSLFRSASVPSDKPNASVSDMPAEIRVYVPFLAVLACTRQRRAPSLSRWLVLASTHLKTCRAIISGTPN